MPKLQGIRQTSHGWQVYVKRKVHGRMVFASKHFAADTPLPTLKAERARLTAHFDLGEAPPKAAGDTLRAAADEYLDTITAMPTYKDRKYRIDLWVKVLGPDTPRSSITATLIRTHLDRWRAKGASAGTCNLRLTAIRHLWRVIDGGNANNPARDVPRYREEIQPLDLPTWHDATKAIAHVGGLSRLRLSVLLQTGWPSSTLKRLRAEDIDWKLQEVRLHGRKKGSGTKPRTLPITDEAKRALRQLVDANGLGPFSGSSLYAALHRGATKAGVRPFRVYDLRHLFLTEVTIQTHDERAVSELALHADPRQTRRYTQHAASLRSWDALATFATPHGYSGPNPAIRAVASGRSAGGRIRRKPQGNLKIVG